MKGQDLLILLKLAFCQPKCDWKYSELAQDLGMSISEVHAGIRRLSKRGLFYLERRCVMQMALMEFLIYGLKYVFPVSPSGRALGIPTSHSSPPLSEKIISDPSKQYVWPCSEGMVRGFSIKPLYKSVPYAALKDKTLHRVLALVDALRVGKVREKKMAIKELQELRKKNA